MSELNRWTHKQMSSEREAMNSMLRRLAEVGWVSLTGVSEDHLTVSWTEEGKKGMRAYWVIKTELCYLSSEEQESFDFLLTHYFPGGEELSGIR